MVGKCRRRIVEVASIACVVLSLTQNNYCANWTTKQMNDKKLLRDTTRSRHNRSRSQSRLSCRDNFTYPAIAISERSTSPNDEEEEGDQQQYLPPLVSTAQINDDKHLINDRIPTSECPKCHSSNAIVYMIQKGKHSSYERNSTALLLKSLDLLYQNYLSIDMQFENVDVLLFHTGDYTKQDLKLFDERFNHQVYFRLINLKDTKYWDLPNVVRQDNVSEWQDYPAYSIGYRHMIRWYALKLFDFMQDYNSDPSHACSYRYVMRMDEESFLHSPVSYDLFQFMERRNYSYGFRMCSYELNLGPWNSYQQEYLSSDDANTRTSPLRQLDSRMCGFYNNFFLVDLHFVWQPSVQHFLRYMDDSGIMYRQRYNDLQIQTIAVYAFCPPARIHRFLDWSYEHMTVRMKGKTKNNTIITCPHWGAIQAGYLDPDMNSTIARFEAEHNVYLKRCHKPRRIRVNRFLNATDLSPTYTHVTTMNDKHHWTMPASARNLNEMLSHTEGLRLRTISAGPVELADRGILSG